MELGLERPSINEVFPALLVTIKIALKSAIVIVMKRVIEIALKNVLKIMLVIKRMSFLKISDPTKRDTIVKEYLETKKNIWDNLLSERTGEQQL